MIPAFDPVTGLLPPGIHEATWLEVAERLGFSPRRQALLDGIRLALQALAHAGCGRVYLAGIFVTAKADPRDWDGAWERHGVQMPRLDKAIARANTTRMYMLYGGEIYAADDRTITGEDFVTFFQHDRAMRPVGIIALDPATAG